MSADTPLIDIRPDHWDIVRHILRRHVPQYAVWAFGSRAKWTAKQYSDLDLAVITDKPLPLSVSAALADGFSESNLPWKVDVVDWAATSESFRKVIERDKVVVHTPIEMGDWRETTLGEVCKLQGGSIQTGPFGSQLHASDYTSAGTPVVMPINLIAGSISEEGIARVSDEETARLARHKLAPGDIVFSRRGDVTRFALVSEREAGWLCGTGCLKVSVGNSTVATPGFIAAVLASPESKEWLIRHAVGATMPNLNTEILAGIPVTLPPLEEQRAIASILGALDGRIKLNRRMNQTLEAMARALFKSRFVDFDGVPPEDMQESELGLIPKGWRVETLAEAFEINPRHELKKGTVAPYLDMASLPTASAVPDMPVMREFSSGTKFTNGDTLLARITPCLENGKTAFVDFLAEGQVGWGSTEFIVLRPKPPLPPFFGYLLARRVDFREHAIRAMSGTSGRQRVEVSQLHKFKLAMPDEATARAFAAFIEPLQKALFANEMQAATLAALRDTLLSRLISGKLRIQNAEAFLKERIF